MMPALHRQLVANPLSKENNTGASGDIDTVDGVGGSWKERVILLLTVTVHPSLLPLIPQPQEEGTTGVPHHSHTHIAILIPPEVRTVGELKEHLVDSGKLAGTINFHFHGKVGDGSGGRMWRVLEGESIDVFGALEKVRIVPSKPLATSSDGPTNGDMITTVQKRKRRRRRKRKHRKSETELNQNGNNLGVEAEVVTKKHPLLSEKDNVNLVAAPNNMKFMKQKGIRGLEELKVGEYLMFKTCILLRDSATPSVETRFARISEIDSSGTLRLEYIKPVSQPEEDQRTSTLFEYCEEDDDSFEYPQCVDFPNMTDVWTLTKT